MNYMKRVNCQKMKSAFLLIVIAELVIGVSDSKGPQENNYTF